MPARYIGIAKEAFAGEMMAKEAKDEKPAATGGNNVIVGTIISLFFPGLGLLLSEKKLLGMGVFVAVVVFDVVISIIGAIGGAICLLPALLLFAIPFAHLAAVLHTYDVLTKEAGGKPIFFK